MAERTVQILPGGQSAAPFTYTVPSSTSFTLMGVRATFDGTGAGGDFLPCVQLVSDAGVVMAQTIASSVAAGASADATFAPFLDPLAGGAGFAYTTVQDEGVALTQRRIMDFIGSAVTATDDPVGKRTKVTIGPAASGDIGCRVFNSTAITVTTGTRPAFTFDSEVYDTDGMHSTTVNPERITCVTSGKYLVGGCISWAANTTGNRDLSLFQNSLGAFVAVSQGAPNPSAFGTALVVSAVIDFAAGDWIELRGRQDSGGNLDVSAINNYSPYFWAQRLAG